MITVTIPHTSELSIVKTKKIIIKHYIRFFMMHQTYMLLFRKKQQMVSTLSYVDELSVLSLNVT